jgi:transcriptional regulator with XRE-family HTH domain
MLKQLREKRKLSQTQTAKLMRMNVGFWNRIESGKIDLPPKRYKRASEIFKVPVNRLVQMRVKAFEKTLKTQAYGR